MSNDFLDRLERELVRGMERYERRSPLRRWLGRPRFAPVALPVGVATALVIAALVIVPTETPREIEAKPAAPAAPAGVAGQWRKAYAATNWDVQGGEQLHLSDTRWRAYDRVYLSGSLRWRGNVMLLAPTGTCRARSDAAYRVIRDGDELRVQLLREPCAERRGTLAGRWASAG